MIDGKIHRAMRTCRRTFWTGSLRPSGCLHGYQRACVLVGGEALDWAIGGASMIIQAMRQDPAPLPFLQEALTIAKFEPGVYEVVRTFTPAGEPN